MEYNNLIANLDTVLRSSLDRYIRGIGEETGEVIGAYNKWTDGRTDKPHTSGDIIEEISQLIACCFLAAYKMGYSPSTVLLTTRNFINRKTEWSRGNGS